MSDVLTAIKDESDLLTNTRQHSEPRWERDEHRNKKPAKPHITTVPGLIQQLRDLAAPGAATQAGSNGFNEAAPVAMDAVSLLASIEHGAAKRLHDAAAAGERFDRRLTAEDCLLALVGLVPRWPYNRTRVEPYRCEGCAAAGRTGQEHWSPCHHCTPNVQTELLREFRSWRYQAEIIAEWRTPPRELPAPCPQCGGRPVLAYADPDNARARCAECDAQWAQEPGDDEGHIDILSRYVQHYTETAAAKRAAARTAAVEQRRREAGEPRRDTPEGQPAT